MESLCPFWLKYERCEREETVILLGVMLPTGDQRLFTVHLLYVTHCARHQGCKSVLTNPCSQVCRTEEEIRDKAVCVPRNRCLHFLKVI